MRLQIRSSVSAMKPSPRWQVWIRAFRLHFVIPSVIPGILGAVIAWSQGFPLKPLEFLLVIVGVAVNHFGLNMIDDVFDYLHVVDLKKSNEKNPFTGGSGVLPDGLLTVREMLAASALCFAFTIFIGLYLTYVCGVTVLILGLIGMASSVFYTMPPVKFGYRGCGELGLLVNFGPVILLGSYFVQAGRLAWEPLLVSLIPGFMMWSMIIINEIPDYEADRGGGKNNLVVLFGRKTAVVLYAGGLLLAYLTPLLGIYLQLLSPYTLLSWTSLPLAWRSINILTRYRDDPIRMAPANLAMIKVHALTGAALIVAYLLQGLWPA
ncbi:MAG: prenyltransferase [Syntrophus sp. (in: bacteria)]